MFQFYGFKLTHSLGEGSVARKSATAHPWCRPGCDSQGLFPTAFGVECRTVPRDFTPDPAADLAGIVTFG